MIGYDDDQTNGMNAVFGDVKAFTDIVGNGEGISGNPFIVGRTTSVNDAGGLSVLFDPALIEITSASLATPWLPLSTLVIDNSEGKITDITFGVFVVASREAASRCLISPQKHLHSETATSSLTSARTIRLSPA